MHMCNVYEEFDIVESQIEEQKLISIKTNWKEEENSFFFSSVACMCARFFFNSFNVCN